jgi:hypothetical protein
MIWTNLYFWIPLAIVACSYLFIKNDNPEFILYKFFPSYIHFVISIIGAIVIGYYYNLDYQIYCQPVIWSKWLLVSAVIWFLTHLLFPHLKVFNSLFSGLLAFISVYLILFGSTEYLIFIMLNGILFVPLYLIYLFLNWGNKTRKVGFLNLYGLVILLPYIILIILIKLNLKSQKKLKLYLFTVPLMIVIFSTFTTVRMKTMNYDITSNNYDKTVIDKYTNNIMDNYLLELSLGAHWKYHTRICLYDGWRPPYHDPVLVLSSNFSKINLPFLPKKNRNGYVTFSYGKEGHEAYEYAFPKNKMSFDCKCGKNERWPKRFENNLYFLYFPFYPFF